MKTLILNGSPRTNGVTFQLLKHVQEQLSKRSEVDYVHIYNKHIRPCMGCEHCRPNKRCILPADDAHHIAQLIEESDVLILGSPTYWGNITGPMKTLFDRCVPTFEYIDGHGVPKKMQKGKTSLIVTASHAPAIYNQLPNQSRRTIRAMKTVPKAGGYRIKGVINVADSGRFVQKKKKTFRKLDACVARL